MTPASGTKKLSLFQAITALFILMPFSLPLLTAAAVPVVFVSGFIFDRWMITFTHSPRDHVLRKVVLMMPIVMITMIALSLAGLGSK